MTPEGARLEEDARRARNWRRWGPYLAERQWGTVREDYSGDGDVWTSFPHDHARSRVYRWGEDGLLGLCDRECRLCFALALWNERDPILKERLFGVSGHEGNHGEDVKERYYYLDATPTFSYGRALYVYPQAEFPYGRLVDGNRARSRAELELELEDTGVLDGGVFDVTVEYAKASPDDVVIRISLVNRGDRAAPIHLLPTFWQRNTWSWGRTGEGYWPRGRIEAAGSSLVATHPDLGRYELACAPAGGTPPRFLFTDNETNTERLFGVPSRARYTKDAFHRLVVAGETDAVSPEGFGTKAAAWWRFSVPAGGEQVVRLRLRELDGAAPWTAREADELVATRRREADLYHASVRTAPLSSEERRIARAADAGLVWSRQFYHLIVPHWLDGDPGQPPAAPGHAERRDAEWRHLYARDVITMPDKWEYPWFAAWDLAFHCVAMARTDPELAKSQLLLLMREWYAHPNGALPAYEFAFGDANPPLHAWAAWRVYRLAAESGHGKDRVFLARAFHKALVNFGWWVNRKDQGGRNLFEGGFLGLDNIGVFDRSRPLPGGVALEQADATAWMAFYCTTMLAIALELANDDRAYSDIATKFLEHFLAIAAAMNRLGDGLWDDEDGFYYDVALVDGRAVPLRLRSLVGLVPLLAAESLDEADLESHPRFMRRLAWSAENEPELMKDISCLGAGGRVRRRLLAIPSRERLVRVLRRMLDERELLSPFGIRSLSKAYADTPYVAELGGTRHEVGYTPGESDSGLFGGNSNWRGPVWLPLNYLLIEALKRHHHFYGETLLVECPTGSGVLLTLRGVAEELERRLARLFLPDASGRRPYQGAARPALDAYRDHVLFYEYFHGDTGRGVGASHQTGWTALIGNVLESIALARERGVSRPGQTPANHS